MKINAINSYNSVNYTNFKGDISAIKTNPEFVKAIQGFAKAAYSEHVENPLIKNSELFYNVLRAMKNDGTTRVLKLEPAPLEKSHRQPDLKFYYLKYGDVTKCVAEGASIIGNLIWIGLNIFGRDAIMTEMQENDKLIAAFKEADAANKRVSDTYQEMINSL